MNNIFLALVLYFSITISYSQDTLSIMHYNILNYGNNTGFCSQENNNIDIKDEYIRMIFNHIKPDIFTVNEISNSQDIQRRMLDENINQDGSNKYEMANFMKIADSYIVNQMYFNSSKLGLHSHSIAQSYIRDIDVYKLYYKSDDIEYADTAFITCLVAHLKAGNSTENANKRSLMVGNALDYLDDIALDDNYIFMGDFNTYKSSEAAYQLLINNQNNSVQFIDPIDTPGNWNNNYDYRFVHTQSTHSSSNGCAASGGMDDRFDFILISDNVRDGNKYIQYLNDSYIAIGQDGLHFNSSINSSPENQSAPAEVIEALYGNSDHLPVVVKVTVDKNPSSINYETVIDGFIFNNPMANDLSIKITSTDQNRIGISIYNMLGNVVIKETKFLTPGEQIIKYRLDIPSGIYMVVLTEDTGLITSKKLIVTR
ncbi:MAG: T9SS type A sorting domain-containing protein [Bacteroidales bacterium]|jgi:endonuclease/exonuclease/phosphatase family metal-dependent hydrolase|nr:T9SS type A sorting domain-containing protein [Bacteroidales bacterium]